VTSLLVEGPGPSHSFGMAEGGRNPVRRWPVTPILREVAMAQLAQNVIQHDFSFPRFVDAADAEVSALYSLCIVVSACQARSAR
jgi:hypothetical protein